LFHRTEASRRVEGALGRRFVPVGLEMRRRRGGDAKVPAVACGESVRSEGERRTRDKTEGCG
jgi:hypothetical protein